MTRHDVAPSIAVAPAGGAVVTTITGTAMGLFVQNAFRPGANPFQPLRRPVQRAVDQRFDRATYDAQRTVGAYAERLRDEVALDAVVADLHETVGASIRPSSFGPWLRPARAQISGPT